MKAQEVSVLAGVAILLMSLPVSAVVDANTISGDGKNMIIGASSWVVNLFGPVVVGLVVLVGQALIAPMVAERVRTAESLLDRRYTAYNDAVNLLQRRLASVPVSIGNIPQGQKYVPADGSPTQLEANVVYTLLSIYGTSASVANKFKEVFLCQKITATDVGEFVSQLRNEMKVKGPKLDPKEFSYIWSIKMSKNEK